jgi:phosphatidylserine decarboxylase
VIAPADGVIQAIQPAAPPLELGLGGQSRMRISIFMNVFNVHVNRSPVSGEVVALHHRPGNFSTLRSTRRARRTNASPST